MCINCGPDRLGFSRVIPERFIFWTPEIITLKAKPEWLSAYNYQQRNSWDSVSTCVDGDDTGATTGVFRIVREDCVVVFAQIITSLSRSYDKFVCSIATEAQSVHLHDTIKQHNSHLLVYRVRQNKRPHYKNCNISETAQ